LTGKNDRKTIGVILLNLGGPDSPQAVKPFLYNLFSDRQIIQLGPSFLQKPLARLISTLRSLKTEKMYNAVGGKSQLAEATNKQARALEELLNKESKSRFKVYVGMRYWHPLIEETIKQISSDGIKKLVVLSLYPHYSSATSGSSIAKVKKIIEKYSIETSYIDQWFEHPGYIDALVEVIKKGLKSFSETGIQNQSENIHVLFSAHSLPQKLIDKGDPYVNQIKETIHEITKKISLKWHLSYQSKSGPVKWLKPSTNEKLKELAKIGVKNVLMVPISFVSDNIETLYEIDILYKQRAEHYGIVLKRAESLNANSLFIKALKDIVINKVKEINWQE
jgi:ferrochelatase